MRSLNKIDRSIQRFDPEALEGQSTSILSTLGILNFRQFPEQPALLVKKYFATKCTTINSKQMKSRAL
jgi:hypothetical protein